MELILDEELISKLPLPLLQEDYSREDLDILIYVQGFVRNLDLRYLTDYQYAAFITAIQMN